MAAIATSNRSLRPVALLAYVFAVTMTGTTLPTPLYPAYEHRFMFGQLTETVVFATYAIGVLATLLLLGQASDRVGRRPMLFTAVTASAVSSIIFIVADNLEGSAGVVLLLLGRLLSGLSGGLMTGTATAALADAVPPGSGQLASLVAAMSSVIGLGIGPLAGGLLLAALPHPLVAIYVIYLILLALAAAAIGAIPETVDRSSAPPGSVVTPLPFTAIVRQVSSTGLVGFAGFAVLGLFTGVSAALLALSGITSPVTIGAVAFSVFAASAVGQLASARLPTRPALLSGTAVLAAGIVVVGLSLSIKSVLLMVVGGLIAGAGQGMSFRAALGVVTASAAPHERGEAASSFFVVCYLGISLPILALGIATQFVGLHTSGQAVAFLLAAICAGVLIVLARLRGPGRRGTHEK
jgi:MFS family permease